jgi:UTP--glucose-1-phosphate uridylyltransferase
MEDNRIPFLMEVCLRSPMDKKGGHLCEDKSGQLLLREIAQCPEKDLPVFQDIDYYKYFNTNNLWIDLRALEWHIISNEGLMLLPLIVNPKMLKEQLFINWKLQWAQPSVCSTIPRHWLFPESVLCP